MIIINSVTGKQMRGGKWTLRSPADIVKIPEQDISTLSCLYDCQKTYPIFWGDDDYKNDKSGFLFSQITAPHTTLFYLVKNGIEYPLIDDTYGELIVYDDDTSQYIVDWKDVYDELGNGIYSLKKVENVINREFITTFGNFQLMEYNERIASKTIRLSFYQSGSIENFYDFKNYEVFEQIRLRGELVNEAIISEVDSNPSSKREEIQVHDRDFSEYDLKLYGVNDQFFKLFKNQYLMSDVIEIDTYAMFSRKYKQLKVRKKSIEIDFDSLIHTDMTIKLEDYKKDRIKHSI